MKRLATIIATAAIAVAAAGGLSACGTYSPAYVVGETYCPGNIFYTCLVMSNGDIVGPIQQSVLQTIVTGMTISTRGGNYRFYRSDGCTCQRITTVAPASRYSGRPIYKTPKDEASAEQYHSDYNDVQKAKKAAASASARAVQASRSAVKASQQARYASQAAEPQDSAPKGYTPKSGSAYKAPAAPANKAPVVKTYKIGK